MFQRLQQMAVVVALLWIAYELHALRVGRITVNGAIDTSVYLPGRALEVEIVK